MSGVQRKWLISYWELVNVFSLSEIKCCSLEWMTVFSSDYPSTTSKVVLLLAKDDRSLSEVEVKTWVDNYKVSLHRRKKSGKGTDHKDKDQQ